MFCDVAQTQDAAQLALSDEKFWNLIDSAKLLS